MNKLPTKEIVLALRKRYPKGTRVVLVRMNDFYTKLRPGDLGTVDFIDDAGTTVLPMGQRLHPRCCVHG